MTPPDGMVYIDDSWESSPLYHGVDNRVEKTLCGMWLRWRVRSATIPESHAKKFAVPCPGCWA